MTTPMDPTPSREAPDALPVPRLQLRWVPSTRKREYQWECHYELVMPLREHDIRREDEDGRDVRSEFVVAMKEPQLRGSTGVPCQAPDGTRYCDTPFRDGAHAHWDAEVLGNLPVYVIAPDGKAFKDERS